MEARQHTRHTLRDTMNVSLRTWSPQLRCTVLMSCSRLNGHGHGAGWNASGDCSLAVLSFPCMSTLAMTPSLGDVFLQFRVFQQAQSSIIPAWPVPRPAVCIFIESFHRRSGGVMRQIYYGIDRLGNCVRFGLQPLVLKWQSLSYPSRLSDLSSLGQHAPPIHSPESDKEMHDALSTSYTSSTHTSLPATAGNQLSHLPSRILSCIHRHCKFPTGVRIRVTFALPSPRALA